jgi:hypothetical protein
LAFHGISSRNWLSMVEFITFVHTCLRTVFTHKFRPTTKSIDLPQKVMTLDKNFVLANFFYPQQKFYPGTKNNTY